MAKATDKRSTGLFLNLSSNNPFRNCATSPGGTVLHSLASPFDDPEPSPASQHQQTARARPVSRNPFLDSALVKGPGTEKLIGITDEHENAMASKDTETRRQPSPSAEDIFDALTLDNKARSRPAPAARPDGARGPPGRRAPSGSGSRAPSSSGSRDLAPSGRRGQPPPDHRPSRSQEETIRARRPQGAGPSRTDSHSPQRRGPDRRPQRNSESSVADEKALTDEERRAKESRRRERERERARRDKKPVNKKLDVIDQLDATSIYGTGLFHHDGPFDALNPHRNKRGSTRAPIQAFPKDSLNNALGGSGPLTQRPDHAVFLGHKDEEAFKEWSSGGKERGTEYGVTSKGEVFDPLSRNSIVHTNMTFGLGTSTFLEGTPAARSVQQKLAEERNEDNALQRKKSLAQRFRSINRGQRELGSGRMTNPEGVFVRSPNGDLTPASPGVGERNTFFSEFDTGKKGDEGFSVRKMSNATVTSPLSPGRGLGLERRATTDARSSTNQDGGEESSKLSFISRVKSLKSGRPKQRAAPTTPTGSNGGLAPAAAHQAPAGN